MLCINFSLWIFGSSLVSKLGVVQQCTLIGAVRKMTYDGNSYCMAKYGQKKQNAAIKFCKKMNAGLPLPKSKGEVIEFLMITGSGCCTDKYTWIGLTDSTQSGYKSAWLDLEGNPVGSHYVNLRVITLKFLSLSM